MVRKVPHKWRSAFWYDLGERVAASAIGGFLTLITTMGIADLDTAVMWTIVVIPTLVSLLKGLLVNLKGEEPSASLTGVDSFTWHKNIKD